MVCCTSRHFFFCPLTNSFIVKLGGQSQLVIGYETPYLASALKEGFAILVMVKKLTEPETKPANGLITTNNHSIIYN